MIENVGSELKKYLEGKSLFASLLGFDMIILYGSVALLLLGIFISLGGLVSGLLTYLFLLGIVLALANLNFTVLFIGLGARAAIAVIEMIILIFSGYLSWYNLFTTLIFGYFAYEAYKKTIKKA